MLADAGVRLAKSERMAEIKRKQELGLPLTDEERFDPAFAEFPKTDF